MKKLFITHRKDGLLPLLVVLLFSSCVSDSPKGELVEIDLTKNYPEKQIDLREIADISYIRFNPGGEDEYLFRGSPAYASGNVIIMVDFRAGTFYFFTPDGTPVSTFNRLGQGPEEYFYIHGGIAYDEKKDELFVGQRNHIKVYSSNGEYKRTLALPEDALIQRMLHFDDESLLIQDDGEEIRRTAAKRLELTGQDFSGFASKAGDGYTQRFLLISKTDGELIEYIPVPEDYDLMLGEVVEMGDIRNLLPVRSQRVLPYKEGVLLCNQETDTVFYYDKNRNLTPVWVQHPSAGATTPNLCMNVFVENSDWQFFEKTIVKMNPDMPPPYITIPLMRDKKSGAIYTQKIIWNDYKGKEIHIASPMIPQTPGAKMAILELPLFQLQDAYAEGRLSGELKELVASMDEEENELYLLLRFK